MGKNSNPIIGYWYGLGVHMGLCVGPIDALTQIVIGGKQAWSGNQTASGNIVIDKPGLFGGEHKEGGIQGTATVMMGEPTQAPNAYLQAQLGTPMPAFRGLCTVVYKGLVSAMSPYLKAWSFQVSKWTVGWRTPVWQPTLAKVNEGMNPAHIIYRAITDPVTGLGRDPATLDLTQMLAAAQTLSTEGFGLNFKWSRSDVLANFVAMVCSHVGGDFVDDPTTGLEYLKLYRADYDITSVPVIDESNIIDLTSFEVPALAGSVNEVTVTYHDYTDDKDHAITVQNLANVQAQGTVVNQSNQYPSIGRSDLATRVAMRDLRAQSALPVRLKVKVLGTLVVKKGDVLAFSWARLDIANMAVRVLEIDRGTPTDSSMTLTCAQDVYDVPSNAYVVVQPPQWTAPNTNPAPVPDQQLVEASYRDLVANLRPADLAQVGATAGYLGALADLPPCVATGYQLQTSLDNGNTWQVAGSGPFAPSAVLQPAMPQEAGPSQVTLIGGSNLSLVKVPCEVLVDSEIMRCDALNTTTGVATLARGCVDTVPAAHVAGARVWFTDGWTAADTTEYVTGETLQAKLLPQASSSTLDPSLATTASLTFNERQARPYPPAGLKVNGQTYPVGLVAASPGNIPVAWVERNRITQADQLIDTTAATIAAEAGTTYTLRTYLNGSLVTTQANVAVTNTNIAPGGFGLVRIEIDSVRGGIASWQPLAWTFQYQSALVIATGSPIQRQENTAGTFQLQANGGATPYTWSVDPATPLPTGMTMDNSGLVTDAGTAPLGDTPCTFTVTDAIGSTASKDITISVGSASFIGYVDSLAPVAHWRMGDAVGSTYLNDRIANEHATLTGTYTLGVAGLLSGDGDTAVQWTAGRAYTNAGAKWALGTGDCSLLIIAKWTVGTFATMAALRDSTSNLLNLITVNRTQVGDVETENWDWNNTKVAATDKAYNDGARHVVMATFEASTKTLRLYVDGVLKGNKVCGGTRPTSSTMWATIAANSGNTQNINATLDEFVCFDKLLTDADAANLSSLALTGAMPP